MRDTILFTFLPPQRVLHRFPQSVKAHARLIFSYSRRASFPHLFQVSSCCSIQLYKHCYITRQDGIYTYNVTRGRVQLLALCTLISSLYYLIQWSHTLCCYLQLGILIIDDTVFIIFYISLKNLLL